jgi:hypothetical protein
LIVFENWKMRKKGKEIDDKEEKEGEGEEEKWL